MKTTRRSPYAAVAKRNTRMTPKFRLGDLVRSTYGDESNLHPLSGNDYDRQRTLGLILDFKRTPGIEMTGVEQSFVYTVEWLIGALAGKPEKYCEKFLKEPVGYSNETAE